MRRLRLFKLFRLLMPRYSGAACLDVPLAHGQKISLEDGSVGLAYETILHLLALRRAGRLPDRARVVEIGAQQLSNSFLRAEAPLAELCGLFGRKPADPR